jgi:hypothetical protein
MRIMQHCSALLERGSLMRIQARPGERVACLRGMVWLTQEQDAMDRVIAAGEDFVCDRAGVVLVNALAHDAVVEYLHRDRCTIKRPAVLRGGKMRGLATDVGRVGARIDPQRLAAMPIGIRREAVEREVQRMRRQVAWLVFQHARRAVAEFCSRGSAQLRNAIGEGSRHTARKARRVTPG